MLGGVKAMTGPCWHGRGVMCHFSAAAKGTESWCCIVLMGS